MFASQRRGHDGRVTFDGRKPSLFSSRILPVGLGDLGLRRVAVMEQNTVAQGERLAPGDRDAAVALGVLVEVMFPKRIDREKSIIARVPVSRMLDVRGTVEDSDAQRLDSATQDATGLANTLRVLEGVAADGKQWIAHETQAPDACQ